METNTGSIDDSHVATDEVTMDQATKNIPQSQHQAAMDSHHNDAPAGYNFRHDSFNIDGALIQNTHTADHENFINVQFQASQSLWTRHYGLLSFSSKYQLSDSLIPSNPRIILSKISHPQHFYAPFHVLVVYAPASKDRREFFDSVLDALNSVSNVDLHRIIILGDFNYSYHRLNLSTQTSLKWVPYLEESFYNVMHSGDNSNIPTFRRND
ncbi:hypothetical protein G6F38_011882 [Rhizopus arrhizus]|nr:hypothetical protein G6F38_011882 [Rhizopus arrhizus]